MGKERGKSVNALPSFYFIDVILKKISRSIFAENAYL